MLIITTFISFIHGHTSLHCPPYIQLAGIDIVDHLQIFEHSMMIYRALVP